MSQKNICSMTGYGKGTAEMDGRKLTIELKSVNHRFLDLFMRFSRQFNFAEDQVRKQIGEKINRGHIDIFLQYEDYREKRSELVLDTGLLESYLEKARELKWKGCIDNFGNAEILENRDLVKVEPIEDDENILKDLVKEACDKAIDELLLMRKTEGAILVADITDKIESLEVHINAIAKRSPQIIEEYREKLQTRVKELLEGVEVDDTRIAQEIVFFIDKINIDEEITRLRSHIKHYDELLSTGGNIGKSLDFLTQELLRETNTIGSKINDSIAIKHVLKMKTIIEMIREQVQNIE
ncbi:MAG TPA: YicC family protein [Clostridia bacterium]|nr:YicC family protein [Clostridia bacterium]